MFMNSVYLVQLHGSHCLRYSTCFQLRNQYDPQIQSSFSFRRSVQCHCHNFMLSPRLFNGLAAGVHPAVEC